MKPLVFSLALATVAVAFAAVQNVSVSATAGKAKDGKAPVTVSVSIPEGYHIYGPKAGSTGIATSIKVKGSDFKIAKTSYPKTKTMVVLGEKFEIYENKVAIPLVLQTTKKLKGAQKVHLIVTTQSCNDRTCMPAETKDIVVNVKL